jgi:uncharacterized membrane protein YcaP (DUF421 family)
LPKVYLRRNKISANGKMVGVEFLAEVKLAYMEADGSISIITSNSKTSSTDEQTAELKSKIH